jgi:uncharacterized protein (DUF697 family)
VTIVPSFIDKIRQALKSLNPDEVRAAADRPVRLLILSSSEEGYAAVENFLLPSTTSKRKRADALDMEWVARATHVDSGDDFQLLLCEEGMKLPRGWRRDHDAFEFDPREPGTTLTDIITKRTDLSISLARRFEPFRTAVVQKIIKNVSKENAMFSLLTALPNVLPSPIELPWAVGEFASDTVVLTANQIRMAFLLAAASGHPVGYREQRSQIGSIIAGAWGWRAIARELIGKIPLGGGLIPKAAVAYAGTLVVGKSLERYYRLGYGLSQKERRESYERAFEHGKGVASGLLNRIRRSS